MPFFSGENRNIYDRPQKTIWPHRFRPSELIYSKSHLAMKAGRPPLPKSRLMRRVVGLACLHFLLSVVVGPAGSLLCESLLGVVYVILLYFFTRMFISSGLASTQVKVMHSTASVATNKIM